MSCAAKNTLQVKSYRRYMALLIRYGYNVILKDISQKRILNRCHDQHVRENAPVERERASGSGRREPAGKVDLDVVKIQKIMIERVGRLVDRLLDGEEKLCPQRVVSNRKALAWRGDQLEHVRRQRRGRIDIDADRIQVTPQPDSGDSNPIIMCHRAYDSGGPDRGAKCAPEDRKAGKAHRVHQLARHTPCGAAGAAPLDRREG
jgi:hypothetical protein